MKGSSSFLFGVDRGPPHAFDHTDKYIHLKRLKTHTLNIRAISYRNEQIIFQQEINFHENRFSLSSVIVIHYYFSIYRTIWSSVWLINVTSYLIVE